MKLFAVTLVRFISSDARDTNIESYIDVGTEEQVIYKAWNKIHSKGQSDYGYLILRKEIDEETHNKIPGVT